MLLTQGGRTEGLRKRRGRERKGTIDTDHDTLINSITGKHRRCLRRRYDFFQVHFKSYLKLRSIRPFRKLPPQFSKKGVGGKGLLFFRKEGSGSFKPHVSTPRACSNIAICWTWMTSPQSITRSPDLPRTQEWIPSTPSPVNTLAPPWSQRSKHQTVPGSNGENPTERKRRWM